MGVIDRPARTTFLGLLLLALLGSFVLSSLILLSPSTVYAQQEGGGDPPAVEKKESGEKKNLIWHYLSSIGIVFGIMFAAISVGMVALIVVLLMDLRLGESVPPAFVEDFTSMVNSRQFKQAFDLCKEDNSFVARVMSAGKGRLQYGIEDAREAMLGMVETVRSGKDGLISYLACIGTLGPMLGLVGTVSGMVGAFKKLGESTDAPKPSELAGEISHALVVTLVGVAISVPAIFFYTFFRNRLTAIAMNTSNLADDLLTQMYHNSKKTSAAPSVTAATGVQTKA